MTASRVRLGLVGVGRWGLNYVRTLANFQGADLVAVASRGPNTRQLVPTNCTVDADWRAIIERDDVEGIIVATPPKTHFAITLSALEAGKAVLVEKPLTQDVGEADALNRAAQYYGRLVMVEHTHLFHPAFVRLCVEVAARGPVRAVRSSAGNRGPYRADVSVLWDWGPHDVAMCLALFGNLPLRVHKAARLNSRLVGNAMADRVRLYLFAGANIPITLTMSTLDDRHRWFAVDLDDATLIYSDSAATPLTLYRSSGAFPNSNGITLAVPNELPLTVAVRHFVTLVSKAVHTHESLGLGARVVACLAECESLLNGN